ncbi:MAG: HAMP domain-containing protein [Desulfotomaculaceae bacterium]|nr:HAMP domain-containing protein [Desulfotomaculaceae bacterium]
MKLKIFSRTDGPGIKLSVTTKIAIAMSLLISFLMAAVGASVLLQNQALIQKNLEEKGWHTMRTVLNLSSAGLLSGDKDLMNNLVNKIGADQDISHVMILDSAGRVLAKTGEKQSGAVFNDEDTRQALAAKTDKMIVRHDAEGKPALMDFYTPIKAASGGTAGFLQLGVDLSELNQHAADTIINIVLITIAAIFAGIFLAALITKRILQRPLLDLTAATEKLATGDFSYKVPVRNLDELGNLATAFNTMSVHLANLIQSVKSSAADINKSAEQILGRLKSSNRANNRLSQTFDMLKQDTGEQVSILKKAAGLSDHLYDQSKHAMDCILQILSEVNKTVHAGEGGFAAISKIDSNMEGSCQSLENIFDTLKQLEDKKPHISETIGFFAELMEKNKACTVQVALHAARTGNEELTRSAEDLHRITEKSNHFINELSAELDIIQNTCRDSATSLGLRLESLLEEKDTIRKAGESLEKAFHSLLRNKDIIEEIASSAHKQAANIEDIKRNHSGIIEELNRSMKSSSSAENDAKMQMENLHDIDSLAKKMVRMVDRLNVLSLQFKV